MAELAQASKAGGKRAALRVDLTAMVDLAFLLVTFFMLTTTLSKPRAMDLAMPVNGADGGAVAESRTVTLCIGNHDQLYLYHGLFDHPLETPQVLSLQGKQLRAALLTIRRQVLNQTGKSLIVLVKPGEHSKYGNLVNVIDEVNITQVPTYAVVKLEDKEAATLKDKHIY